MCTESDAEDFRSEAECRAWTSRVSHPSPIVPSSVGGGLLIGGDRKVLDELDVLRGGHGTVLFFEEEQGELSPSYTS